MPSKKKKYNARFPAGRIKKIMQTDEEVGKVAQAVPIIISRTLELFVHSLLTKTMQITNAKNAKTLSPSHMKQCILSESRFDFLKDLVKCLPDVSGADDEVPTPPLTPAPIGINPMIVPASAPRPQSDARFPKDLSKKPHLNQVSNQDCIESVSNNVVNLKCMEPDQSTRIPNFQISMPSSFQACQPNFYTELNQNNANPVTITQPTSNFGHTANIDEDYDT
ncbi:nuclear transcription factor Y subunit C-7 [Fopius arisanus]|uniref:Nuclear transcription factor Y subunit C-7 n=1 Tax=Fopius arisanus TaxID=64838 RepID=A0A9R1T8T0_9HYME|nr:PREDICTED: nuclear transcription factor Y subunit C-7 [Fopius arisanus]